MRERFEERLTVAGLELRVDAPDEGLTVKADAAGEEHILFNLIDSAAKYAVGGGRRGWR